MWEVEITAMRVNLQHNSLDKSLVKLIKLGEILGNRKIFT